MTTSQPLLTPVAAEPRHTRSRATHLRSVTGRLSNTDQLVRRWRELAVQTAELDAHGHADPDDLFGQLLSCEAVLRDRHPEQAARWDALLEWESALIHIDSGPSGSCATCRRGRRALLVSQAST